MKWSLIIAGTGVSVYGLFQIEAVRKKWNDALGAIGNFLLGDAIENSIKTGYFEEDDLDYGMTEFRSETGSKLSSAD
jgi:hypothetical protein